MVSKAKAQQKHAKRRAYQRYGLWLHDDDIKNMVEQIQSGRATFVDRQSHRVTHWIVEVEKKKIRVCYDKTRKQIITCLPESAA